MTTIEILKDYAENLASVETTADRLGVTVEALKAILGRNLRLSKTEIRQLAGMWDSNSYNPDYDLDTMKGRSYNDYRL